MSYAIEYKNEKGQWVFFGWHFQLITLWEKKPNQNMINTANLFNKNNSARPVLVTVKRCS